MSVFKNNCISDIHTLHFAKTGTYLWRSSWYVINSNFTKPCVFRLNHKKKDWMFKTESKRFIISGAYANMKPWVTLRLFSAFRGEYPVFLFDIILWGWGVGWGGLPPNLLYRISTIRSAENYLPNNYLKSPQNSSLLTLITLNFAFKHISFIHCYAYKKWIKEKNSKGNFKFLKKYDFDHIVYNIGGRMWILQYFSNANQIYSVV